MNRVSLSIGAGEIVAFLGPNGAGKTTTLKMLSGILHPTSGSANVLGFVPWRRERAYLMQIAFVRGSRPLSVPGELTVLDGLRFQQQIYRISDGAFKQNLSVLSDMLGLNAILERQVRALSLGERMRAGLASSLLYKPKVLFLDEPTIGLDVSTAMAVRRFIAAYTNEFKAAVLLTSHYMADVEQLCKRLILIHRGSIHYDGSIQGLKKTHAPIKIIRIPEASLPSTAFAEEGAVITIEPDGQTAISVPKESAGRVVQRLMSEYVLNDFIIEEPPIEQLIDRIYREGAVPR
ncbi:MULTISPECIES: ATP-binding cassette domain-containing protein [unclassified Paenibacillus]|uniref:ABC transporter ATP-binding protein n=1 Tax=unclassified Paenibacillus TaxID=185978 RepID=UPI001C40B5AB|nr:MULTISPECIES: ATP-binding cassette domain-containing protein [unclassified Paenibacillus]